MFEGNKLRPSVSRGLKNGGGMGTHVEKCAGGRRPMHKGYAGDRVLHV